MPAEVLVQALWLLLFVGCSFFSSDTKTTDKATTVTTPVPDLGVTKDASMTRKPDGAPKAALSADSCDDLPDGGENKGPECITDTITCGQTIVGQTEGGPSDNFSTRFYEKFFCTPATTRHDKASERVYELKLPDKKMKATVWLETPCADLDVAAVIFNDDNKVCPTEADSIRRCEMWPQKGNNWEKLELINDQESRWLLIVEGKEDNGAFALHVECVDGL